MILFLQVDILACPRYSFHINYRKSSIKPPWGAYLFPAHLRGGFIEKGTYLRGGGLFNLKTTMVSVLHKELDCEVEKLKYKKF